jgi:hypothetical protein
MQVMLVTCRPAFSGALKSWCLGSRECRHMSLSEESWHICYSVGGGPMLISSWLMAHGSWSVAMRCGCGMRMWMCWLTISACPSEPRADRELTVLLPPPPPPQNCLCPALQRANDKIRKDPADLEFHKEYFWAEASHLIYILRGMTLRCPFSLSSFKESRWISHQFQAGFVAARIW